MNTKRFLGLFVLGLFMISMTGSVLALTPQEAGTWVAGVFKGGATGVTSFASEVFGVTPEAGITKFLFIILLTMIIHTVVSSFFSAKAGIRWTITISISLLAFIGIPKGYLEALTASYGAMGLTILTVIPFLIIIIFTIKLKNLMIARGTWAFYVLYYLFLVFGEIWKDGDASGAYWVAFLGGIFMFWTIPYIRHMFSKGKLEGYIEKAEEAIEKNVQTQKLAKKSREGEVGAATS